MTQDKKTERAGANTNKDTILALQMQRGKINDIVAMLYGLRQEQVVAIHVNADPKASGANREVAIHYFAEGGLDVKHKRKAIVPVESGWATIYAYHEAHGIRIFTGNADLAKIRMDVEALGALVSGMQQIKNHHGFQTSRLQLCGRAEISIARVGNNWFNLSEELVGRPALVVIDVDQTADTIYGFRMDREGNRTAIVKTDAKSAVKMTDSSKWDEIAKVPAGTDGQFAGAGRLIRAKDGTVTGDVIFTDGTKRAIAIRKENAFFGIPERSHDEQVLSRVFFNKQPGLATQTIVDEGVEIYFYPPTKVALEHRAYAEIAQNA